MNHVSVKATLLVAPGCPHCPHMKQAMQEMLEQSRIVSLELVDISIEQERAAQLGVRGVPWLKLNTLELQGSHSPAELEHWVEQAGLAEGRLALFDGLLEVGQLSQVETMLRRDGSAMSDLLTLLADQSRQINVRIGASAIIEGLADSGILDPYVDDIGALTCHADPGTRTDACHILSFIHLPASVKYLESALGDEHPDVRETARDSLEAFDL